ncbi:UDP-N-acetylglucosamine 2-epimerase (non-hydrolyzing) [Halorubrum sp. Ib24]|uniref:non-hydrolyzing UDP-N-acetylglucosamine 2-epimerase n=1 Tax=Halorubrum sp. Ib24 TaxID=1383850 RepID=UPI000B97E78B|nr:UDP-N-acetylglucosamine 2-epimerase (non-hydrolyzing) [Halorubrum sp. Ib24]OYR38154.1 UDP-N-acetylglucosamine 2-epimerase (non-hydrolyzing) [Halorubrum sp. Ib24]
MSDATVLSVVGARPQFIKAFPVSRLLREHLSEVLVHTGQHYDFGMSDVFFEELDIPEPDYNLGVGSANHANQTAEMLRRIDEVVEAERPDLLLVHGDTNSTLAGALVAAKRNIAVAHVEAGLRSDNWAMPEEVNRVLTDRCSDLLFVPSERAVETLTAEGVIDGVTVTGDVMYDAITRVRDRAPSASTVLDDLGYGDGEYVLATVHRQANTDDPTRLASVVEGLASSPRPVVVPLHPRTEDALKRHDLWERAKTELDVIDPVGYLDFVGLLDGAERVATDSGGVQKEAFYLDTRCVTLRDETEWVETVEAGWNELVGADAEAIRAALRRTEDLPEKPSLYGGGHAAERVVDDIVAHLRQEPPKTNR